MELQFLKPTSPSQRNLVKLNTKPLLKNPSIKTKIVGLKNSTGRNHSGKITVRHKGKGHKKRYRKINFLRNLKSTGIVIGIEYDPCRNSNIASIFDFRQNCFFYILAPKKLKVGNIVESGLATADLNIGNTLPLFKIPEGSFIHNITPTKIKKAQLTRSGGTFAVLKKKNATHANIELSSRKEKLLSLQCYATLGRLSNESYLLTNLGKAGRSRWLNRRPKVRGVAMNPVDHPNGGGEGKKSGKKFSPWGKPNKKKKYKK